MENRFRKYVVLIIPILFLLYSAPGALDFVFHFPDEKYYTDSAIRMMEKEDYFTPYQANGEPRFKKPIVTYWVLLGSYKMFGVSKISSRLFFWLTGALLVLITCFLTKSLINDRRIAFTAAFILASNPMVMLSASRSIPDILLVLFLTLSAWGFLKIMLKKFPEKKYYWLAYVGAALAFETKGLPAAAFAGISFFFLLLNPWKKVPLKKLIEPTSMVVAIVVALSWFVIMYVKHGTIYLDSFFADQVGDRVSSKISQVFVNTGLGIFYLVVYLIPWIVILFFKFKRVKHFVASSGAANKAIFGFILFWTVLMIMTSGAVFKFYDRYILPVIPLISIFTAIVFLKTDLKIKKPMLTFFAILNTLFLTVNIFYALFIFSHPVLVVGSLFSFVVLGLYFLGKFKSVSKEIQLANGILLFYFIVFVLLHPLLMPNPGEQLVNGLRENGITEKDNVYVYGNIRAASNIRIHSHNTFNVISMDTVFTLPSGTNHFLVFNEKEKELLNLKKYNVYKGSEEWSAVPAEKFPSFLSESIIQLKNSGTRYLIAEPKLKE